MTCDEFVWKVIENKLQKNEINLLEDLWRKFLNSLSAKCCCCSSPRSGVENMKKASRHTIARFLDKGTGKSLTRLWDDESAPEPHKSTWLWNDLCGWTKETGSRSMTSNFVPFMVGKGPSRLTLSRTQKWGKTADKKVVEINYMSVKMTIQWSVDDGIKKSRKKS